MSKACECGKSLIDGRCPQCDGELRKPTQRAICARARAKRREMLGSSPFGGRRDSAGVWRPYAEVRRA